MEIKRIRIFRNGLRSALSGIHLVDRFLMVFMLILLLQSAYSLFFPSGPGTASPGAFRRGTPGWRDGFPRRAPEPDRLFPFGTGRGTGARASRCFLRRSAPAGTFLLQPPANHHGGLRGPVLPGHASAPAQYGVMEPCLTRFSPRHRHRGPVSGLRFRLCGLFDRLSYAPSRSNSVNRKGPHTKSRVRPFFYSSVSSSSSSGSGRGLRYSKPSPVRLG